MITRKSLEAIAEAMKDVKPSMYDHTGDELNYQQEEQWESDVKSLSRTLSKLNPRFDEDRFLIACGFTAKGG